MISNNQAHWAFSSAATSWLVFVDKEAWATPASNVMVLPSRLRRALSGPSALNSQPLISPPTPAEITSPFENLKNARLLPRTRLMPSNSIPVSVLPPATMFVSNVLLGVNKGAFKVKRVLAGAGMEGRRKVRGATPMTGAGAGAGGRII